MSITVTQAFKDSLKGPVDRSQIKIEVLFSGSTWTDITSFVQEASGTQEEVSQLSGGASANTLSLTLINDDGRFSPKNTASPYAGNLVPNKPIRVSSVYGSESVREFTGYVSNWIPNAKSRNCQVTAEDAARILRRRDITEETVFNDSAPTTGYYLTRIIERAAWLSGLRWDTVNTKTDTSGNVWAASSHDGSAITVNKSAGAVRATYTLSGVLVMTLDLVDLLIPVAPLKGKCLAVLDQLAKVVDGCVYFDAQGQLVFRSRMYRNDSTLTSVETLTVSSLEDVTAQQNFEDSRWGQVCNRATVRSTPYTFRTDTNGNVIEESIPFKGDLFARYFFAAGESYPASGDAALWCEIPNGIKLFKTADYPTAANLTLEAADRTDITKPTTGIELQAGFPTFEQNRIGVAFVNNGSGDEQIKTLTFKGKLMRPIQRCQSIQKNQASIDLYDQRDWEYTNDLIPNASACKNLAAWKVEDGREPKTVLTLPVMYGIPWLELGDRITVSETITKTVPTSEDFIVRRISWRWSLAAFAFTIEACSPAATFTASNIPVSVVNVETVNQNNNGQESDSIPFQTIDGAGKLVGLNNIPAFNNLLRPSILKAATGEKYLSCYYDGGFVWTAHNGASGSLKKIDPYALTVLATYAMPALWTETTGGFYSYPAPIPLASDDASLYYHNNQTLYKFDKTAGTHTQIAAGIDIFRIFGMLAIDGKLFVSYERMENRFGVNYYYPMLAVVNTSDGTYTAASAQGAGAITADLDYVYVFGASLRYKRSDGTTSLIAWPGSGNAATYDGRYLISSGNGKELIFAANGYQKQRTITTKENPRSALFDGSYYWVAGRTGGVLGTASLEVFDKVTFRKVGDWAVGMTGLPDLSFTGTHIFHCDGQDIRRFPRFSYGTL